MLWPPKPSGSLFKSGGAHACQSGGTGCYDVGVNYQNVPQGNYTVDITRDGRAIGTSMNVTVGGNGSFTHHNHLGVMTGGETIAATFRNNATGETFTIGSMSGSAWNNL